MNDHEKLLNTLRDLLKNSAYYWKKSLELPGDKQGFFMSGYSKGMRSAVDTLIKNLRLYIVWEGFVFMASLFCAPQLLGV